MISIDIIEIKILRIFNRIPQIPKKHKINPISINEVKSKIFIFYNILIKQLKLIKILDNINKNPKEIGRNIFQPNLIN